MYQYYEPKYVPVFIKISFFQNKTLSSVYFNDK